MGLCQCSLQSEPEISLYALVLSCKLRGHVAMPFLLKSPKFLLVQDTLRPDSFALVQRHFSEIGEQLLRDARKTVASILRKDSEHYWQALVQDPVLLVHIKMGKGAQSLWELIREVLRKQQETVALRIIAREGHSPFLKPRCSPVVEVVHDACRDIPQRPSPLAAAQGVVDILVIRYEALILLTHVQKTAAAVEDRHSPERRHVLSPIVLALVLLLVAPIPPVVVRLLIVACCVNSA